MENTILNEFIEKVSGELKNQDDKWGESRQKHPLEWQSIAVEEVGEIAKEINDSSFSATQTPDYEDEVIQVAACMFRMYAQNRINLFGTEYKKLY